MPLYCKQNKEPHDPVIIEHIWVEAPIEGGDTLTCLVHPKIAAYILLLESQAPEIIPLPKDLESMPNNSPE